MYIGLTLDVLRVNGESRMLIHKSNVQLYLYLSVCIPPSPSRSKCRPSPQAAHSYTILIYNSIGLTLIIDAEVC